MPIHPGEAAGTTLLGKERKIGNEMNLSGTTTTTAGRRRPALDGRRALDLAEGILVAVPRCEPDTAFGELVDVAKGNGLSLFAVASALVALASCTTAATFNAEAALVADRHWGELL